MEPFLSLFRTSWLLWSIRCDAVFLQCRCTILAGFRQYSWCRSWDVSGLLVWNFAALFPPMCLARRARFSRLQSLSEDLPVLVSLLRLF